MSVTARPRPRIGDGVSRPALGPRTPRVYNVQLTHQSPHVFASTSKHVPHSPYGDAEWCFLRRTAIIRMCGADDLLLRSVANPRVNEFAQTGFSHRFRNLSGRRAGSG